MKRETKYIQARPDMQFGSPCIKGTRIQVFVIKSMHKGGDSIKQLMFLYDLSEAQVRAALRSKMKSIPVKEIKKFYKK